MAVNVSRSHFSLGRGLLISVTIHALPFALMFAVARMHFAVPQQQTAALQIELFGMVTGQQVAAQQATVAAAARQAEGRPSQEEQEEKTVPPEESPHPTESKSALKPVTVRQRKRSVSPAPPHRYIPASTGQQAREGRVQQTISPGALETSLKSQYLAQLSRIVRNKLVYPVKAKAKGWTGVTFVAFTVAEGGSVVPGSESVRKTSGYADLDQAALNAVRGVAHLPNPPHQMEVVVAIEFTKSDS